MGATDKAKNKMQEMKGAAKEKYGEATDNEEMRLEGKKDKAAGSAKGAGEKVKDTLDS
jgi:uncharacterized protein YjbJ (UPF0337 family)